MPAAGPGSIARFGPRLVAVLIDWALCTLIAYGLFKVPLWGAEGQGFIPLAIFAVENLLLVGTLGQTIGMRIVGLRVSALGGSRATVLQVAVRTCR